MGVAMKGLAAVVVFLVSMTCSHFSIDFSTYSTID